jgi:hypothetical protein
MIKKSLADQLVEALETRQKIRNLDYAYATGYLCSLIEALLDSETDRILVEYHINAINKQNLEEFKDKTL